MHFKRWQEKHEKKINNDNDDDDDGDDNDDDDEDTEIGSHINKDDKENDDHLHFHIRKIPCMTSWKLKVTMNTKYQALFKLLKKCTAWYPIKISLRLIRVTFFKGTR